MSGKQPKQAFKRLLLASHAVVLTACASQPDWIIQPPATTVSACAPASKHGWQLAELRAKAQFADAKWLTQYQQAQRQQLQDASQSNWQYQQQQHTQQLQLGVVHAIQQIARWQGQFGNASLQCVLVRQIVD